MEWKWAESSLLNSYSQYSSCKDIFQAVSDEVGRYFAAKGLKYIKSRPKITYQDNDIKLEVCFWSSRSNTVGSSVSFEIVPNFYSQRLKGIGNKGFILDHFFILGTYTSEEKLRKTLHSNHFNVYNLTTETFGNIINTIEYGVFPWVEKLKTSEGVKEMVLRIRSAKKDWHMNNRSFGNSVFAEYVAYHFPELAQSMDII